MKKRLIASSVIAVSAAITALTPLAAHAAQQSSITESGSTVAINVQTVAKNGIAEVVLLGPPTAEYHINRYSYALPVTDGHIVGNMTNPWSGKTNVSIMQGRKTVATGQVDGTGPNLSEQAADLLPSYLMDSNIPTVSNEAHAIASSVTTQGTARTKAVAEATETWVKQHIHTANQAQTARADQTLTSGHGDQASRTALAVALLRADNIPAKAVQRQVTSDAMYGTSYSVDAWIVGKWVDIGTP